MSVSQTAYLLKMFYPVQVVIFVFFLLHQYEVTSLESLVQSTQEKCFDELGCFSIASPFFDAVHRPLSLPPQDREVINTTFLLYTPLNPSVTQNFTNLRYNESEIRESNFNPELDTKILVPGYISRFTAKWEKPLIKALLADHDCNVFLVDWSGGDGLLYEQAIANARVVGAEIALFISHLKDLLGVMPENIHLIGHSLGVHVSGYAGKRLQNLGRITGLDAAGPCFMNVDPVVRLDRGDALFVDVIHTNAKPSRFQGFGTMESIGHFDFYPNGGSVQPGCDDIETDVLSLVFNHTYTSVSDVFYEIGCNHLRAIDLVTSSLRNKDCELMAVLCDSWESYVAGDCGTCDKDKNCAALGARADHYASMVKPSQSLNFYLNTTDKEPYCLQ